MKRQRGRKRLPAEPFALTIEAMSHEGRGIAHREGKVVFVEEALQGESVEAVLTERRPTYEQARAVTVHSASPDRVTPPCEYAGICGGCSLQHMAPAAQIRFKESVLHEKMQHETGHQRYERLSPVTGPDSGYRRKARLGVRYVAAKEEVLVGFREKRSNFITHMKHCHVLESRISQLLPDISSLIAGLQSFRSIPQIEVAMGDAGTELPDLALIFRHLAPLPASDEQALLAFARQHTLALYLQSGGPATVTKIWPEEGPERLCYRLPAYDLTLHFHPMDFTQVNAAINEKMIASAIGLLALSAKDRVLDLFCGLGNFTLPIARHCAQVCGVEGVDEMVARGQENAALNGISNAEFHCADLTQPVEDKPWLANPYNKVLLDPPRSGAKEVIPNVLTLQPERIVYVSCNPATLARDAALLEAGGYTLQSAGVLDMFPHTAHVESIALFVKAG